MRRLLLALAIVLPLGAAATHHAVMASAGTAQVAVVNAGTPVAGQAVVVLASEGKYQGVTDQNGRYTVSISGKYYRLRVNNKPVTGIFQVNQGAVQVDISTL